MSYQPTYYQTTTLPVAVPTKPYHQQDNSYYAPQKYGYSVSPPEASETSASGPTYSSANSSSYAGSVSGGDYESASSSANGVDMQEYMQDRFQGAFDPLPLDRTLAVQAQT